MPYLTSIPIHNSTQLKNNSTMSTSVNGKDERVVEMVENSLSYSDQMAKVVEHEFMEAEKQMTIWQAAKAHKRILLYCKSAN